MNTEPPQMTPPKPKSNWLGRAGWLLLALSPTALIIPIVDHNRGEVVGIAPLVMFGLNPLVSIFASYKLFHRSDGSKTIPIVGGILVGFALAMVNAAVGYFGGCACGGHFDMK